MIGFSDIRAQAWKFGAIGAAAAALCLGIALGVVTLQKNAAVKRGDALYSAIHAPVTGYIARKAVCDANVTRLETAVTTQNAAVARMGAESAGRITAAEKGLAAASRDAAEARVRADRLLRSTVSGPTLCARYEEADRQLLEELRR